MTVVGVASWDWVNPLYTGDFKSIVQNRDENPRMRNNFNSKSPLTYLHANLTLLDTSNREVVVKFGGNARLV